MIIHMMRPTAIEHVIKGDETDEALRAKAGRGITLVSGRNVTPAEAEEGIL